MAPLLSPIMVELEFDIHLGEQENEIKIASIWLS